MILDFAQIFKKSFFTGMDPDIYGIENFEQSIAEQGLEDRVTVENMGGEEMDFMKNSIWPACPLPSMKSCRKSVRKHC